MKVKANLRYKDLLLNRVVEKDEVIEVDEERAKVLTTATYDGKTFCHFVEEEPNTEEQKPNIEEQKPNVEEQKPNVEEPKPKRGRPKKA
jgi:hypothetical protein